ncbi:MAG: hydrogenase maturation protease [archaeon]|nr:hydrogenase maturation protease [archaeon]MCP8314305.1 hydrogenase maturation protease [archaeon]MCP8318187.1 hydrogenase maturation protease [archaeon]MCP8319680.1 hydrogenase maturation protease [archaeon]
MRSKDKPSLVVIGVGNILCSDEGVGVHIVNELQNMTLPPYVAIFDCGTSGIAVLEAMDGAHKAIIIDAVYSGGEPGTVYLYTMKDLLQMEDRLLTFVSLHQFDLISTLKLADLTNAYKMPYEIVLIGIEAKSLELSMSLSDEVKKAFPKIIEAIMREIQKFG